MSRSVGGGGGAYFIIGPSLFHAMYTVNMLLYFALSHCNCDAYMYMYKIVSLLVHVKLTSVEANKFQVYTLHRWKLPGGEGKDPVGLHWAVLSKTRSQTDVDQKAATLPQLSHPQLSQGSHAKG